MVLARLAQSRRDCDAGRITRFHIKLFCRNTVSMSAKRRKAVGPEGRAIIASVYRFLRQEYEFTKLYVEPNCDLTHLRDITRRTAEATGVSTKTVQRILKEEKELLPASPEHSPHIKRSKNEDSDNGDFQNKDSNNKDCKNEYSNSGDFKNKGSNNGDSKTEDTKNENCKNDDSSNEYNTITSDIEVKVEIENITIDAIENVKREPLSDTE